eukprot:30902-Pelagococcus_subviridis.AAC.3
MRRDAMGAYCRTHAARLDARRREGTSFRSRLSLPSFCFSLASRASKYYIVNIIQFTPRPARALPPPPPSPLSPPPPPPTSRRELPSTWAPPRSAPASSRRGGVQRRQLALKGVEDGD